MKRIFFSVLAFIALSLTAQAQSTSSWGPVVDPASPFSFYVGAHGAIANADVDLGPINLGANGQAIGGRVGMDAEFKQFFVGALIDADKVFGDLESLGVDWDASVNLRAGPKLGNAKLYGIVGYGRTFGGGSHLDYLAGGVGTEMDLGSNWSARLEYTRREYRSVPLGLDLGADVVKGGLNYRF